jgi:hypothetical protein
MDSYMTPMLALGRHRGRGLPDVSTGGQVFGSQTCRRHETLEFSGPLVNIVIDIDSGLLMNSQGMAVQGHTTLHTILLAKVLHVLWITITQDPGSV